MILTLTWDGVVFTVEYDDEGGILSVKTDGDIRDFLSIKATWRIEKEIDMELARQSLERKLEAAEMEASARQEGEE